MTLRRTGVAVVVLLVVAALGFTLWWVLAGRLVPGTAAAGDRPQLSVRTTPDPADLAAVSAVLTGLPGSGLTALSPATAAVAQAHGVTDVLPAGTTVDVLPDTWADTGFVATVRVRATPRGGQATEYLATLLREPGGWRLGALSEPPP